MKAKYRTLLRVAAVAALLGIPSNTPCYAQEAVPLAQRDVPRNGTFYLLTDARTAAGRLLAPLPCPPAKGVIYRASEFRPDVFLADCRAQAQVDAELLSALASLRIQLAAADAASAEAASGEMSLLSGEEGPPLPGDGGGGSYGILYGTNDLWITIEVTNSGPAAVASFTIHPPDTNTCWDLIGTTNLTTATPVHALNLTNWAWVLRTELGETNVVVTNLWPDMGFFRLGTMADSDEDGLTDALEWLVSHSNPNHPDADGDGLGDLLEYLQGLDPNGADTDGDGFKDVPFALHVTQPAVYAAIP
jgi:hypothetical protein